MALENRSGNGIQRRTKTERQRKARKFIESFFDVHHEIGFGSAIAPAGSGVLPLPF